MAVKPLKDIMAAMGKTVTTAERTARLSTEIARLGDDAPQISMLSVTRKQMLRGFDLILNLHLDIASELGLLPKGKDEAMREMRDALDFVEVYAIYEEMVAVEAERNDERDE